MTLVVDTGRRAGLIAAMALSMANIPHVDITEVFGSSPLDRAPRQPRGHGKSPTPKQELEPDQMPRELRDIDREMISAAQAKRARRAAKRRV